MARTLCPYWKILSNLKSRTDCSKWRRRDQSQYCRRSQPSTWPSTSNTSSTCSSYQHTTIVDLHCYFCIHHHESNWAVSMVRCWFRYRSLLSDLLSECCRRGNTRHWCLQVFLFAWTFLLDSMLLPIWEDSLRHRQLELHQLCFAELSLILQINGAVLWRRGHHNSTAFNGKGHSSCPSSFASLCLS